MTKRVRDFKELKPDSSHLDTLYNEFITWSTAVYLDTEDGRHDYYVDGKLVDKSRGWVGVTSYISGTLFAKFDSEEAIQQVFNSWRYEGDPVYRYHKMSKERILCNWDESSKEGTKVHNAIDNFFKTRRVSFLSSKDQDLRDVKACLRELLCGIFYDYKLFASEATLVDRELRITGCVDALIYCPKKKSMIVLDWKRNSVKQTYYATKGIHPLTFTKPDNKYWHYHCQVNIYDLICRRNLPSYDSHQLYVIGFGLDKQLEQKEVSANEGKEERLSRLLNNMDICEMKIDYSFQKQFVIERMKELKSYST